MSGAATFLGWDSFPRRPLPFSPNDSGDSTTPLYLRPMRKVGVLSEQQSRTSKPTLFVSKNAAEAMCRRLTHVRISKWLIKAVHVREFVQRTNEEALPIVPTLNPPGYHCLPYNYPLPSWLLECYE